MPDKIVNHFVLADGSIAKYNATQLVGDIPEVVGIRTGYGGTVYPSAGDAVRGQAEKLKNAIKNTNNIIGEYVPDKTIDENKYYDASGNIVSNTSWNIVTCDCGGLQSVKYSGLTNVGNAPHSVWLDSNGTYINGSAFKQKTGENILTVPNGAKFVSFSVSNGGDDLSNFSVIGTTGSGLYEEVNDLKSAFGANTKTYNRKITKWGDIGSYTGGYIKTDGTRALSSYLKTSEYIMVNTGDTISASGMSLNIGGSTIFGIACYDENKQFVHNIGITGSTSSVSGSFTIPEGIEYIAISDSVSSTATFNIKEYTLKCGEKTTENTQKLAELETKANAPLFGKTICNFGDSIFGNARPPLDISTFLAERTGATVYNCGFGGCRMGYHSNANYDAFSMYRLADAISSGDFREQETAASVSGMPSYFSETVALLETIDFSTVDIITISYGTNDFADGLRLGGDNNRSTDLALKYSIETILTAYPNIRIFVCVPFYRVWLENGVFDEDSNTKEVTSWSDNVTRKLTDFVQAEKDVCKETQTPVLDTYYDLGINQYNWGRYFPSTDGTHHNLTGRELIAEYLATHLW